MCVLSLLGIILMIIDNELTFAHVDHHETIYNWFVKFTITISTILLIGLILYYHYYEINLYCVNNSIECWSVGLTARKIVLVILEIVICAIHPIPRTLPIHHSLKHETNTTNSTLLYQPKSVPISLTYIPIDVALSLPSKLLMPLFSRNKRSVMLAISVRSTLFMVSFHYTSFTFGSEYIIAITWISQ